MHSHANHTPASTIKTACDRTIALLGAPNTGKTSLFTTLTGRKRTIANWPGATVDIEIGVIGGKDTRLCLIDLPGTYGLYPTSPEEELTLRVILEVKPSTILVIVDAENPEASIPLLIQALEAFPGRILVAVTKASLAHSRGVHLDVERLSQLTRAPVVVTSVLEGIGVDRLKEALLEGLAGGRYRVDYGHLEDLVKSISSHSTVLKASSKLGVEARWLAVQILLSEPHTVEAVRRAVGEDGWDKLRRELDKHLKGAGTVARNLIIKSRLDASEKLASRLVVRRRPSRTAWQRLANAFMHPTLGPLISILGLLMVFTLVFAVNTGFPLNLVFERLGWEGARELVESYNMNTLLTRIFAEVGEQVESRVGGWLGSLLAHGLFGGVGFVLSFLPLIMMMYLALGILEDSGLAARMAVSLHPLLERFGLTGRSVFPLTMGFGCNVPAVMSMRGLPWEERMRAVMAAPFVPCQARLAVLFALSVVAASTPLLQALTVASAYLVSITLALATAFLVGFTTTRGHGDVRLPFIMEVPEVHRPHWRVVWWYVRDNTMHFLRKAATIVFALAIITWALLSLGPQGVVESPRESYGWRLGGLVGKALAPLGVEGDAANVLGIALLNGLVAKEGVLAAIAVSTSMSEDRVATALMDLGLKDTSAFSFMLLVTLYFPCIATLSSMVAVTGRPRVVALFSLYSVTLALGVAYASNSLLTLVFGGGGE